MPGQNQALAAASGAKRETKVEGEIVNDLNRLRGVLDRGWDVNKKVVGVSPCLLLCVAMLWNYYGTNYIETTECTSIVSFVYC